MHIIAKNTFKNATLKKNCLSKTNLKVLKFEIISLLKLFFVLGCRDGSDICRTIAGNVIVTWKEEQKP